MIRGPEGFEEAAFRGFLDAVEDNLDDKFLAGLELVVEEAETETAPSAPGAPQATGDPEEARRTLCLATRELLQLPLELLLDAEHAGLPVGELEADGQDTWFTLDLQGATRLAALTRAQTVRVRERAAHLFLYGRDILGESVLWYDGRLKPGDACVVCSPRGEALGIGAVVGRFKGQRSAVRPLHDLGSYLRDES